MDVQSKLVKKINTSTKKLQKQILKIQGVIQKEHVKEKVKICSGREDL